MKHYLVTLSCLIFATTAQAQVRFGIGPVGAYTLMTGKFEAKNDLVTAYSTSYHSGFAAGLLAEVGVGHFAIQPSVQFTQKGYSQQSTLPAAVVPQNYSRTGFTRLNYLAIPLNFAYTQRATGQGFQVVAGPYLSILTGGTYSYDTQYSTPSSNNFQLIQSGQVVARDTYTGQATDSNYYFKQLDFGLQAGVGYHYQGLLVQASYGLGLRNLAAANPSTTNAGGYSGQPTDYYNRGFSVAVAYLFGLKS